MKIEEQLSQIVEETIKLEQNVAELYNMFSDAFPEDFNFWKELFWEEKHHASLIDTGKNVLMSSGEFPRELLSDSLQVLVEANNKIRSLLKQCTDKMPSRAEAFNIAISLEESAGEIHYQRTMDNESSSEYIKMWQKLNEDDKDHALRIRKYMTTKDI